MIEPALPGITDPVRRVQALRILADGAYNDESFFEGLALLGEAAELADPTTAVPVLLDRSFAQCNLGDLAGAGESVATAAAAAAEVGDAQLLAEADAVRVMVEYLAGQGVDWDTIDRAVAARQPGTVVLLSAVAMQTPGWDGVPPAALYRIVAALNAVGLNGEARMIAAEAVARA